MRNHAHRSRHCRSLCRVALATIIAICSVSIAPATHTRAAGVTVTVNDTVDEIHNPGCTTTGTGICSLRDAVIFANANTDTTIMLGATTYRIAIPPSGNFLDAATGDLDLLNSTGTTSIIGAGADKTIIDGNQIDRVITIDGPANATVTITGVAIRNGRTAAPRGGFYMGGGILNFGTLTLADSVIAGNSAINQTPGIPESVNGIGGGIYVGGGQLFLVRSTITNNSATAGGGITGEKISILNSTISGNTSTDPRSIGSGIGGGLSIGVATITASTIANNSAANGGNNIYVFRPYQSGNVTVVGTIIAGSGTNCSIETNAVLVSQGHNLASDGSCGLSQSTDRPNDNPLLNPLATNGGTTLTHALQSGSPAIDAGGTSATGCPATDQRDYVRPVGAACDIGAFEYGSHVAPTLTNLTISPANPGVEPGKSVQLRATATYSDGSTPDVTTGGTWLSLNGSVAAVTQHGGLATGLLAGTAPISFSYAGMSAPPVVLTVATPSAAPGQRPGQGTVTGTLVSPVQGGRYPSTAQFSPIKLPFAAGTETIVQGYNTTPPRNPSRFRSVRP